MISAASPRHGSVVPRRHVQPSLETKALPPLQEVWNLRLHRATREMSFIPTSPSGAEAIGATTRGIAISAEFIVSEHNRIHALQRTTALREPGRLAYLN